MQRSNTSPAAVSSVTGNALAMAAREVKMLTPSLPVSSQTAYLRITELLILPVPGTTSGCSWSAEQGQNREYRYFFVNYKAADQNFQ